MHLKLLPNEFMNSVLKVFVGDKIKQDVNNHSHR